MNSIQAVDRPSSEEEVSSGEVQLRLFPTAWRPAHEYASPLHRAAQEGDLERLEELIGSGADTRLRDRWGRTPLHCALDGGRESAAELLAAADRGNDVRDATGSTPLHYAAMNGCVKTIRELVAGGSNTRLQDEGGNTPLHRALIWSRAAAAELLAEADSGVDVQNKDGCTPLHHAAARGYVTTIRKLLAGGSRTRVRDKWDRTPLDCALCEAAAELLAEAGCGNDMRDATGSTPLHSAVRKEFQGVVRNLVRRGTNPHVKDRSGIYPIQTALERRNSRNETIPKIILSWYALKGIPTDWKELGLGKTDLRFCNEELSRCEAEIRLMEGTQVPASSLSYLDLATRHVARVVPRLQFENVGSVLRDDLPWRKFNIYEDLVAFRLRTARERRVRADRCVECFSLLSPPLPAMCTDVVLLCLSDRDLENFIRAAES